MLKTTKIVYKDEPVREVAQLIPVGSLDPKAQERARHLRKVYGWQLFVFHDGPPGQGRDIVSANTPFHDDSRDWHVVDFGDQK